MQRDVHRLKIQCLQREFRNVYAQTTYEEPKEKNVNCLPHLIANMPLRMDQRTRGYVIFDFTI